MSRSVPQCCHAAPPRRCRALYFPPLPHAILIVFLSCFGCHAAEQDAADEQFIGWRGASFDPQSVFGVGYHSGPVQVSQQPLAFVWKNFISREEAKHLVKLAAPRLRQSETSGEKKVSDYRSSYGMFIPRYYDEVMVAIQDRLVNWTGLPHVNQEDMQILRYSPGQTYKEHTDGHGRQLTVLIYLTDTDKGGETAFPATTDDSWTDIALKPKDLGPCAEGHVAVKPEVGTALAFYSMPPGAEHNESLRTVDPFSLHTGCPPTEGQVKWTATVWIHYDAFRPDDFSMEYPKPPMPDAGDCENHHEKCDEWAERGECGNNAPYMVGGGSAFGNCALACGVCTRCAADDYECRSANRERLGYIGDLRQEVADLFS